MQKNIFSSHDNNKIKAVAVVVSVLSFYYDDPSSNPTEV